MTESVRVAVTGAGGRLGTQVRNVLDGCGYAEIAHWDVPDHDLDDPDSAERLLARDEPDVVIHCAAWTDVDGCAERPDLAMRRNGTATGELAAACARRATRLLVVSTNEVFDGARQDGRGYATGDATNPINPYGASKLAGEQLACAAMPPDRLAVVRTAWLFGPGAPDFPRKILAAARRARAADAPLKLVADEWGNPTYTRDLAEAIAELIGSPAFAGIHHIVNTGVATRAEWALDVLDRAGLRVATQEVPASTWSRPSSPPRWGALEPTPLPSGALLRPWRTAMADYQSGLEEDQAI